jgi:hypothetical protein
LKPSLSGPFWSLFSQIFTQVLSQGPLDKPGPIIAVSDWMRAVPEQIPPWVPGTYVTLGTDGFGFSDIRPAARRYFKPRRISGRRGAGSAGTQRPDRAVGTCVTREQLFYGDHYSYNRFGPSRLGAGLAAMFPGLAAVDAADLSHLGVAMKAALDVDGPSVVSIECAADEIPPFAAFLDTSTATPAVNNHSITEENHAHVVARA